MVSSNSYDQSVMPVRFLRSNRYVDLNTLARMNVCGKNVNFWNPVNKFDLHWSDSFFFFFFLSPKVCIDCCVVKIFALWRLMEKKICTSICNMIHRTPSSMHRWLWIMFAQNRTLESLHLPPPSQNLLSVFLLKENWRNAHKIKTVEWSRSCQDFQQAFFAKNLTTEL